MFILMFVPMRETVGHHPSTLWRTVWQIWYCIWNWITTFKIGHWIYTRDQNRWYLLTGTVRYYRGHIIYICTHVVLLEIRLKLSLKTTIWHDNKIVKTVTRTFLEYIIKNRRRDFAWWATRLTLFTYRIGCTALAFTTRIPESFFN